MKLDVLHGFHTLSKTFQCMATDKSLFMCYLVQINQAGYPPKILRTFMSLCVTVSGEVYERTTHASDILQFCYIGKHSLPRT